MNKLAKKSLCLPVIIASAILLTACGEANKALGENNQLVNGGNPNGSSQNGSGEQGGNQNGGNQNGGNQNGGSQNGNGEQGSNQNGGSQNGNGEQGSNQNGGSQNGNGEQGGNQNGGGQNGNGEQGSNQNGGSQNGNGEQGGNQNGGNNPPQVVNQISPTNARILFLHHSVGGHLQGDWRDSPYKSNGDFRKNLKAHNDKNGTSYTYTERLYPFDQSAAAAKTGYVKKANHNNAYGDEHMWDNKPFVYWDMWVNPNNHNAQLPMSEKNHLPQADTFNAIVASADLVIFKHCYTDSDIQADSGNNSANQNIRTIGVYKAQYNELKTKMRAQKDTKFLVWTLPPQLQKTYYTEEKAKRAKEFSDWVKNEWDEKGDNIYVFDFRTLAADANSLFLPVANAESQTNNHPNQDLNYRAVLNFVQRTVDVLEGKGDSAPLTGLNQLGKN